MQISLSSTTNYDFESFMETLHLEVSKVEGPIFKVKTKGLWKVYLDSFPDEYSRQEHNCFCCHSFISNFGGLVSIKKGKVRSILWSRPEFFEEFSPMVEAMKNFVESRPIETLFTSADNILGTPHSGGWTHFNIPNPSVYKGNPRIKTESQYMAEQKENFRILKSAMERYSVSDLTTAKALISGGSLNRSEHIKEHLDWLCNIPTTINGIWAAVATAPAGYCNVNSSILGSLLCDIKESLTESTIISRFNAKIDPSVYRRPTTAPGVQNIKRAETLVRELGIESALERRYAVLSDLRMEWVGKNPKVSHASSMGVFGDVIPRSNNVKKVSPPRGNTKITWSKFKRTVLPNATSMKIKIGSKNNFSALVAPVNEGSINIFQWSNPINWFVYIGGSSPSDWGLVPNSYAKVTGITLQPNMWEDECSHQGEGVHFLIKDCIHRKDVGLAIFPEILKSELHEVRKTIESFSTGSVLEGRHYAEGNGIKFTDASEPVTLHVVTGDICTSYTIDRME